ncbi:hypothetical protein KC959_01030 [Candidatus Saccharibacteria bacterium]|nr:hypothetical protein [Candidatus Saccharibacteria bacterium]
MSFPCGESEMCAPCFNAKPVDGSIACRAIGALLDERDVFVTPVEVSTQLINASAEFGMSSPPADSTRIVSRRLKDMGEIIVD